MTHSGGDAVERLLSEHLFSIKPNVTVADPNPNFSIPDPGSKRHRIPDPDTQLIFSSLTPEFSKKLL